MSFKPSNTRPSFRKLDEKDYEDEEASSFESGKFAEARLVNFMKQIFFSWRLQTAKPFCLHSRQFHQRYTRAFFVRTSFRQLFSTYVKKAAKTTFVQKRAHLMLMKLTAGIPRYSRGSFLINIRPRII